MCGAGGNAGLRDGPLPDILDQPPPGGRGSGGRAGEQRRARKQEIGNEDPTFWRVGKNTK